MESTHEQKHHKHDNTIIFYVLGGVIVTVVIIVGFLLYNRPNQIAKPMTQQQATSKQSNIEQMNTNEIAKEKEIITLACSQQYYNTVIGIPGVYYLSTEGEAPSTVNRVKCTIKASVDDNILVTEKITPELIESPTRKGVTFRCTTKGVKLTPNIPTKVTADIVDDLGNNVSCSRTFLLP